MLPHQPGIQLTHNHVAGTVLIPHSGPEAGGDDEDEGDAGTCARLFRGLVFFVGREVPQEQLLLVIRSFGGTAAWDGPASPLTEADESITHQVGQNK